MAKNYDFRLLSTSPASTGWTSATINQAQAAKADALSQGAVAGQNSALAKAPITADALRTTPSTLSDARLGSRSFKNPNTGIRDVAASGSVYAMSDVPAFLSQAVAGLNAEQALRRSVQAEWNDRLLRNAESSSDPYLWMEAIRAASVNPGSSVAFGQQILDPNQGRANLIAAQSNANLNSMRSRIISDASGQLYDYRNAAERAGNQPSGSPFAQQAQRQASEALHGYVLSQPLAVAAAGGSNSGWGGWSTSASPRLAQPRSGWGAGSGGINWI